MLEPGFQIYTPGVRRLYHFEFHRDEHLLAGEVRRTLDELNATVPGRVDKGQLTLPEAKAQATLWLTVAEDLEALVRWLAEGAGRAGWSLAEKLRELRAANGVAWEAKVAALRTEIEARRVGYPSLVAKGMLTRDQAKAQLERLEAVHDLFWRHGFGFDGTRAELAELAEVTQTASVAQFGAAKVPSTVSSDDPPAEEGREAA